MAHGNLKSRYIKLAFDDVETLKYEGIFFSGIFGEGEYREWWHGGKTLYSESNYENSYKNGLYKEWHDNGNIGIVAKFVGGIKSGEYSQFHYSGKIWVRCFYKENSRYGEYKSFDESGLITEHSWRIADRIEEDFLFNKKKKKEYKLKRGYILGWDEKYYNDHRDE